MQSHTCAVTLRIAAKGPRGHHTQTGRHPGERSWTTGHSAICIWDFVSFVPGANGIKEAPSVNSKTLGLSGTCGARQTLDLWICQGRHPTVGSVRLAEWQPLCGERHHHSHSEARCCKLTTLEPGTWFLQTANNDTSMLQWFDWQPTFATPRAFF